MQWASGVASGTGRVYFCMVYVLIASSYLDGGFIIKFIYNRGDKRLCILMRVINSKQKIKLRFVVKGKEDNVFQVRVCLKQNHRRKGRMVPFSIEIYVHTDSPFFREEWSNTSFISVLSGIPFASIFLLTKSHPCFFLCPLSGPRQPYQLIPGLADPHTFVTCCSQDTTTF